ncbi:class I SAM-dependent methyltransferase [Flavisolibacter ginsenosidimutans]|uniref:Class I SAM-dependent methyltransferase n=1 Tax=Flavisolibacter ginsenosidimutans TaxID=661481 RepID=A0A5B8UE04_9BACT|nr:class I SAM-dependent methyltransferase [Flavisolibacter ginsenosidimutans]QEC54652.1 class I SAM-dependent methyltransferase [Flavisolibacter ginsenosidimutans]
MSRIHYTHCPVCNSTKINPLLTVKDYSVSNEDFVIWQCADCTLRFTQDVPDEDSIGPYYASQDYISHSNTDKGLLNKLYQRVRKFTLEQKAKLVIENTKSTGSILDVGAGIGAFLSVMKEKGWQAKGIEPDEGARKNAEQLFHLKLEEPSVLFQLAPKGYDAVTLWHVLEHVHDLHNYVEQLKNLLTGEGKIFIAVPNYTSGDAEAYRRYWAAYDVPRHLYHFTPKAIEKLVSLHGLKLVAKKPMWFDAFYISLLSSKYRNGKTSWAGAGWNGLRSNLSAFANKDKCSSIIYIISK